MSVITNNISGSVSNSSAIGITGSVIIGNAPVGSFPTRAVDTVFFVSGSNTSRSVFGGTVLISGSLLVGTDTLDTITLGSTAQTGTTSLGQSTVTNTINIGNANTADTKTQTINIGAGTGVTSGKSVVTIGSSANASALTLQAGTGNLALTGATTTTYTVGSATGTGTITLGRSTATNTINIGNTNTTAGLIQTINIGAGTGVTSGKSLVTVGSIANASALTLQAGTGDINIAASATTLVGIGTASPSYKLDVQTDSASGWAASFFNDGNATSRYGIRIQSGTDAANGDLIDFYDGNGDLQGTISFNAGTVTYGSFTGDHYAQILDSSTNKIYGTIVKIVQATTVSNRKNVDYIVEKTTFMKDPAVLGVFASSFEAHTNKSSLENLHSIFSLGDGHILVTDQGGNISIGDYICSSDYPGHGMKQDDNILRSYTVAKSTYAIDFSTLEVDPINGFKSVLISCTYHCG